MTNEDVKIPSPPDFKRHVIKTTPVDILFKYVNPLMLYTRHLGIKGNLARLIADKKFSDLTQTPEGEKAYEIYETLVHVKDTYKTSHLESTATYQFFKAKSDGDSIHLYNEENQKIETFPFPRQQEGEKLCLADYIQQENDNLALFTVTVGTGIREEVGRLKDAGEYLKSHVLSALTLELAEGYAEYLHEKIRAMWGIEDDIGLSMTDKFKARYKGKRYSFGYPACPDLGEQKRLFKVLNPENIILTDGDMMDPEASVSALCFHHSRAKYFAT